MELSGLSFIAGKRGSNGGTTFAARNATNGAELEPRYAYCSVDELEIAATTAAEAFIRDPREMNWRLFGNEEYQS
jgi:hypothetical protein